jgi:hypothetical protein
MRAIQLGQNARRAHFRVLLQIAGRAEREGVPAPSDLRSDAEY